jgi:hypothetical protein
LCGERPVLLAEIVNLPAPPIKAAPFSIRSGAAGGVRTLGLMNDFPDRGRATSAFRIAIKSPVNLRDGAYFGRCRHRAANVAVRQNVARANDHGLITFLPLLAPSCLVSSCRVPQVLYSSARAPRCDFMACASRHFRLRNRYPATLEPCRWLQLKLRDCRI